MHCHILVVPASHSHGEISSTAHLKTNADYDCHALFCFFQIAYTSFILRSQSLFPTGKIVASSRQRPWRRKSSICQPFPETPQLPVLEWQPLTARLTPGPLRRRSRARVPCPARLRGVKSRAEQASKRDPGLHHVYAFCKL